MKILILDDIGFRHDTFDKVYAGSQIIHCYSYHDFVDRLNNHGPWDLVHLDHDLGDFVANPDTYVDGWGRKREYNGSHAATKVCELDDASLPKKVIIHSINPEGARRMRDSLLSRGVPVTWEPFADPMPDDYSESPGWGDLKLD